MGKSMSKDWCWSFLSCRVDELRACYHNGNSSKIDFSLFCSGILCMKCEFALNYHDQPLNCCFNNNSHICHEDDNVWNTCDDIHDAQSCFLQLTKSMFWDTWKKWLPEKYLILPDITVFIIDNQMGFFTLHCSVGNNGFKQISFWNWQGLVWPSPPYGWNIRFCWFWTAAQVLQTQK